VERDLGGTLFPDGKHCTPCANSTRVFPAVDPYVCRACPDPLMSMQADGSCVCATDWSLVTYGESATCVWSASLTSIAASYSSVNAQVMQYNDVRSTDGGTSYTKSPSLNSIMINTYFLAAITNCWVQQERHACQMLANMCVLQKYHQSSTACLAFRTRQTVITTYEHGFTSLVGGQDGWRTSTPFLYQSTNTITASAQLLAQTVTLTDTQTDDNSKTGTLKFKLFSYSFNGTFLGSQALGSQLQLCGGDAKLLTHFLRFGTNFENSCQLDLTPFLSASPNATTVFHELFIEDVGGTLFPCPIKVLNMRLGDGSTPNRNDEYDERVDNDANQLTRRFYLVDNLSGKESFGSAPVMLSYAKSLTLRVMMQGTSNENIRPPLLVVEYAEREASDILDGAGKQYSHVSFSTEYLKDSEDFWRAAHGLFGTAIVLALVVVSVGREGHRKRV
jgi:meckelin